MKQMGKRGVKGVIFGLILAMITSACGSRTPGQSQSTALETVKVAALLSIEASLPVWVAVQKGYYKDAGLDVKLTYLVGGVAVRDAVASKDVDIGLSGMDSSVSARAKGIPLRLIATWYDAEAWVFVVSKKNAGLIKSVQDMKGKVIVTAPPGSTAWGMARGVFKKEGLDPDKDVKFLALPDFSPATWINFLESGQADVAVTWEPQLTALLERGNTTVLSMREPSVVRNYLGGDVTSEGAFSHESIIQSKGDMLKKFVRATNQALDFIKKSNAKELAPMIAPLMNVTPELAEKSLSGSVPGFTSGDVSVNKERYERRVKFLADTGMIAKAVPYEDGVYVDAAARQ